MVKIFRQRDNNILCTKLVVTLGSTRKAHSQHGKDHIYSIGLGATPTSKSIFKYHYSHTCRTSVTVNRDWGFLQNRSTLMQS